MAAYEPPANVEKALTETFTWTATVIFVVIFIYHLYTSQKHWTTESSRLSLSLSFSLFFFGSIAIIIAHLTTYTKNELLCNTVILWFAFPPYLLFKLNLYIILVQRLHAIFSFEYKDN